MDKRSFVRIANNIRDTDITTLTFINYDNITAKLVGKIIFNLIGSKVHTLNFPSNRIGRSWEDSDLFLKGYSILLDKETAICEEDAKMVKVTGRGVEYLFPVLNQVNITSLSLENNYLTDYDGIVFARNLPFSNLKFIDLSRNKLETKGGIAIAESIKNSPRITTLLLGRNFIGDEGLVAIFKKLRKSQVRTLDLEGYYYHESLYNEKAIVEIAPLLKESLLQILSLANRNISNHAAQILARNFSGSQLKHINLRCNKIGDEGAIAISESLKSFPHLTTLLLGGNQIGRAGVSAIFATLKVCNVHILDIGRNTFNGHDIAEISPTFQGTHLHILSMRGSNFFDAEGTMALAESFCGSPVTTIDLSGLGIKIKDCAKLFAEKLSGSNIRTVYFGLNFIDADTQSFLRNTYSVISWFFDSSDYLPLEESMLLQS